MKFILSVVLLALFVSCSEEDVKVDIEKAAPGNTTKVNEVTKEAEAKVNEVTKEAEAKVSEVTKEAEAKVSEVTKEAEAKVNEVTKEAEAKVSEEAGVVKDLAEKAVTALKSGNFEVACGKCVFKDPKCKTCEVHVKFADQVYPISGLDLNAKTLGLCTTSATADVIGEIKDGSFLATAFENLKLKLPATAEDALDKIKKISF